MKSTVPPNWLFGLYQLLFALLPWSVEADFGAWSMALPAEPLIAICGIGLGLVLVRERPRVNLLAGLTLAWVLWQAVAALFSSMPLVSWKYWLVETGHWWVFFVGLLCWPGMWPRLFSLFAWSMVGVMLYTIGHHAFYHFRADQAMLAPMPFFADHTVYGAVLVMVLFGSGLRFNPTPNPSPDGEGGLPSGKFQVFRRVTPLPIGGGVGGGVCLALLLSSSRAAWISLALAGAVGLALYFRKQWRWFAFAGGIVFCAGIFFKEEIKEHLAADVSTQERLNRYSCAWRMAADRPWAGFGPGTFQFQYLAYQKPEEMTRISITEPIAERGVHNYGRGGGAHSEYLRALSELGWPGLVLWMLLVFVGLQGGIQHYFRTGQIQYLFLSLALLSFFLHGLVNNFLHDGRIAALVWGVVAVGSSSGSSSGSGSIIG